MAAGLLWPSAAVGRLGPVSCGVTNAGRQRQGGGRRQRIAREPHAARLGSGPPLYTTAARYLPTTCAAVRGPSGPNLLFWGRKLVSNPLDALPLCSLMSSFAVASGLVVF